MTPNLFNFSLKGIKLKQVPLLLLYQFSTFNFSLCLLVYLRCVDVPVPTLDYCIPISLGINYHLLQLSCENNRFNCVWESVKPVEALLSLQYSPFLSSFFLFLSNDTHASTIAVTTRQRTNLFI